MQARGAYWLSSYPKASVNLAPRNNKHVVADGSLGQLGLLACSCFCTPLCAMQAAGLVLAGISPTLGELAAGWSTAALATLSSTQTSSSGERAGFVLMVMVRVKVTEGRRSGPPEGKAGIGHSLTSTASSWPKRVTAQPSFKGWRNRLPHLLGWGGGPQLLSTQLHGSGEWIHGAPITATPAGAGFCPVFQASAQGKYLAELRACF